MSVGQKLSKAAKSLGRGLTTAVVASVAAITPRLVSKRAIKHLPDWLLKNFSDSTPEEHPNSPPPLAFFGVVVGLCLAFGSLVLIGGGVVGLGLAPVFLVFCYKNGGRVVNEARNELIARDIARDSNIDIAEAREQTIEAIRNAARGIVGAKSKAEAVNIARYRILKGDVDPLSQAPNAPEDPHQQTQEDGELQQLQLIKDERAEYFATLPPPQEGLQLAQFPAAPEVLPEEVSPRTSLDSTHPSSAMPRSSDAAHAL